MEYVYFGIIVFIFCLAIFDLMVGVSNDAVNFMNSAIGAKTASFKKVITIAAIGVFCGSAMSNGMMDVARHGIFQPQFFYFKEIMCILLAVMVTDVVLLDMFNSMGMPTSTTVSLVFELLGGTVALAMIKNISSDGLLTFAQMINTDKVLTVVLGIFLSIAIAFFFGALIQYITRIIFTFNYKRNLKWFAGIFGGIAVTAIVYFMLIKGVKDSSFMTGENKLWVKENTSLIILCCLGASTVLMQILHWCKVNVFKVIVLLGTFSLAMAFAGNDLVNFIGVPLAGLSTYQDYMATGQSVGMDSFLMDSLTGPAKTPMVFLIGAGAVMVFALVTSKKAKNVINTSLNLSKQDEGDEMFGTSGVARRLVLVSTSFSTWLLRNTPKKIKSWIDGRFNKDEMILENGAAFDQLRASVNLVVAALLVALGTSLKLPLSTTFVTFMVAMGTSLADRAWNREGAVFRVTGVVSVIGGWFITAGAAFIICFLVALAMHYGGIIAMAVLSILAIVIIIRSNIRYSRKLREEKKDTIFTEILTSQDKSRVWNLLKRHVTTNVVSELDYVSDFYSQFISCFINQNRRCLRRLFTSLRDEKELYKVKRRKELIGLKRTDPLVSIQAGTWFHLTSNNTSQLLYSLRRVIEPCKEHLDNNFNPLPKECAQELQPISVQLIDLINKTSDIIRGEQNLDNGSKAGQMAIQISELIKEISSFKKEVTIVMENNIVRFRYETGSSNLNVYILYQTILQETQQMADTLKHLVRAVTRLEGVE